MLHNRELLRLNANVFSILVSGSLMPVDLAGCEAALL